MAKSVRLLIIYFILVIVFIFCYECGFFGILSNVNWYLGVSGTEGGKMIQDIISASNALNVSAGTSGYQELTGTEARILSDQTYGAMISVPVTYRQTFGYADKAGLYAITVTWNVSQTV